MENKKTRVAIAHGDTNSAEFKLTKATLADPNLMELCTPVMYDITQQEGIQQLVEGFKQESFEAVVITPQKGQATTKQVVDSISKALDAQQPGMIMMLAEDVRIAVATNSNATTEQISRDLQTLHLSIKRDFRISNPRIALLATSSKEDNVITPAIKQLCDQSVQVYGPYAAGDFFANRRHMEFDGLLVMDKDQGLNHFRNIVIDDGIVFYANMPIVITEPAFSAPIETDQPNETDANEVRQAIYSAIDIARHRKEYDKPLANPLKKLYKDRRDDSEKVRFNVNKPSN